MVHKKKKMATDRCNRCRCNICFFIFFFLSFLFDWGQSTSFSKKYLTCSCVLEMWCLAQFMLQIESQLLSSCLLQTEISFGRHCILRWYLPRVFFYSLLFFFFFSTSLYLKLFFRISLFSLYSASRTNTVKSSPSE